MSSPHPRSAGSWPVFFAPADDNRSVMGMTDGVSERRAVAGPSGLKGLIVFPEYFHGDNGAGLGAWHRTGWTALVADLILTLHRQG